MAESTVPSRRERLRAHTLAELKEHALAQVAGGGPEALSLSAIARSMGMSGPALYRYFGSRDDLLAALVVDGYDALADALQAAADGAAGRAPEARLRAVASAYRGWALTHPHRYRLLFSTTYGSGLQAPARTVPPAHRSMVVLLEAVVDLGLPPPGATGRGTALADQLERWAHSRSGGGAAPAAVLQRGVLAWTRLHGVVSLEIEGAFAAMDIDAALLYDAEVDELVSTADHGAGAGPAPRRRRGASARP